MSRTGPLYAAMGWMAVVAVVGGSACQPEEETPDSVGVLDAAVLESISPTRLRADVDVLAADAMGGRSPGSYGHSLARDYVLAEMEAAGLQPLRLDETYVQTYANSPIHDRYEFTEDGTVVPSSTNIGTNLIGVIPGTDPVLADEYIVIMAHTDHLGVTQGGRVYNGAFDNAASVALGLEVARVLVANNVQPKRSLVFLFTDDEESGLDGAQAWLEDPELPLGEVVMGLSVDPTGRPVLPDFWPIVLIGLERSPALLARMKESRRYADVPVHFVHRDVVPVFASDQDRFLAWETPIAAGWYTNPGMSFYHTTDDTPETIDYRVVQANAAYLAQVLVELGNDAQRYEVIDQSPLNAEAAADVKALFEGVLESSVLTAYQRERTEYFISEIQRVEDADTVDVLDNPEAFFFAGAYFLLFELTDSHPGEIPPPFPE